MKKEFQFNFAEMGDFFNLEWTSKKLELRKAHFKEIDEELRLENLTDNTLKLTIEKHDLLKHPQTVILKPKEVKRVTLKIPCDKIKKKHKSYLIIKSQNQKEKIPVDIQHIEEDINESF